LKSPGKSKTKVIDRLIENTKDMLNSPLTDEMKDVLMISCLQTINHYKIAGYKTALTFASELELETAAELIGQVLHWEMETEKNLSSIAVNEVNTKTF
jgi:ferritin-like metal-binding protein YciE